MATTTYLPEYLIRRIDGAIRCGVLPVDAPCSRACALATVGCLPKSLAITSQDVADWINANRVNVTPTYATLMARSANGALYAFEERILPVAEPRRSQILADFRTVADACGGALVITSTDTHDRHLAAVRRCRLAA